MPIRILWGISTDFSVLSPCIGQVAYALRTRPPVATKCIATSVMPLDLHVLGLPLAFILSQDQTLHCIKCFVLYLQLKSQRYCLKFLSSERGKNFSCSTTSKNTVQYIAIRNLLFLRFRQKKRNRFVFRKVVQR